MDDCPKCGSSMESGFVGSLEADSGGLGGEHVSETVWVEGAVPERSMTTGKRALTGRRHLPVTTHRCSGCGYLEQYARSTTLGE